MDKLSSAAQVLGDVLMEHGHDARGYTPADLAAGGRELGYGDLADIVVIEDILKSNRVPRGRIEAACKPGVLSPRIRDAWLEIVVIRAVTNHALYCGTPAVEEWARKWLGGNRTGKAAAEAAAKAAWAAWAAEAAEAETAEEAEYEQQISDLLKLLEEERDA